MSSYYHYEDGAIHLDLHRNGNAPTTAADREMALAMLDRILHKNRPQPDFSEAEEVVSETTTSTSSNADDELLAQLIPMFYGEKAEAARFLERIKGAKGTEITSEVTRLVKAKVISDKSCHRDLWRALSAAGLYSSSETNWNKQVG